MYSLIVYSFLKFCCKSNFYKFSFAKTSRKSIFQSFQYLNSALMSDEDPSLKVQKLRNNEFTSRNYKTINLYCFLQCQTSENFMLSFAVKLKVFIKWRHESLCILVVLACQTGVKSTNCVDPTRRPRGATNK